MALGDLVVGWLLLRQAAVALDAAADRIGARQAPSTRARSPPPAGSRRNVLPELTAKRAIAEATDLSLMELDEAAF